MKPIINEGDYVISIFNESDDEVKQVRTNQGIISATKDSDDLLRNYPVGYSYRIMRCLKNSKYDIHSPGPKV